MASVTPMLACAVSLLLFANLALADGTGWSHYDNGRYAYAIDIPPGFSEIVEPDNGDGGRSVSEDGRAELRVWGSQIIEGDFGDEVASRISGDRSDGWQIAYDKRKGKWASWSGVKNGRIFYQRAIQGCEESAAFFRLEYDESAAADLDPVIRRLVKSLRSAC